MVHDHWLRASPVHTAMLAVPLPMLARGYTIAFSGTGLHVVMELVMS